MPRKKAADRVGPVKTRTRSGCKECRASRVRCDTQKPICSRCRDRGLVCSTELVLKWESEFLSRGLAFGRAGVWSKSRPAGTGSRASASLSVKENEWCEYPPVESWGFVNSGVSTFENPHQVNVACDELNGLVVRARDRELVYGGVASPSSVVVADDGWIAREVSSPPASLSLFPNIPESKSHLFDCIFSRCVRGRLPVRNLPHPLPLSFSHFACLRHRLCLKLFKRLEHAIGHDLIPRTALSAFV